MTNTWTTLAPNRLPSEVANEFVDIHFPGRQIDGLVDGKWYARDFRGKFQLIDGVRFYHIECTDYGKYTITW